MQRLGGCTLPIPELSGLAADPTRGLLYAVGDDARRVYAIDVESTSVVDDVRLEKGKRHDLEGVAFEPESDTWLVVSENKGQILRYALNGELLGAADVDLGGKKNGGLEGLTIDVASGRIFAVHERKPRRIIELSASLEIIEVSAFDELKDLSGICAHDGDVWVVSDKSEALCRLVRSESGWTTQQRWELNRESAEGIAIVGGRMFIGFDVERGDNLEWYDADIAE